MSSIMGVVGIIAMRDKISMDDAIDVVNNCRKRLYEEAIPCGDDGLAEEIIADELGLEPDYIFELL